MEPQLSRLYGLQKKELIVFWAELFFFLSFFLLHCLLFALSFSCPFALWNMYMHVCPHTHRHTHTDICTHNDISAGPVSFPESYQNGRGTELCTSSLSLGWALTIKYLFAYILLTFDICYKREQEFENVYQKSFLKRRLSIGITFFHYENIMYLS